ncbi:hypothetical protein LINGRAHAP2_LOCUS22322 [Linum grandiflorum]
MVWVVIIVNGSSSFTNVEPVEVFLNPVLFRIKLHMTFPLKMLDYKRLSRIRLRSLRT